jgi:hypothetical protein
VSVCADSVVLGRDGGFTVVDRPSVRCRAPIVATDLFGVSGRAMWLEMLFALPSVSIHGGGEPADLWRAHPLSGTVEAL